MTSHRRFDFSLVVLAALLVVQATIVSYGMGFVRDIAGDTQERLTAVAQAGR